MAGAGGSIIGRVGVKVVPDTDGFGEAARRKLKREKIPPQEVKLEIDTKRLRAEIALQIGKINSSLLERRNRLVFHTALNNKTAQMRRKVRETVDQYQALANDELVEFRSDVKEARRGRDDGGASILGIDSRRIARDLSRTLKSERFGIEVDLDLDRKQALEQVTSFRELWSEQLDALNRTKALKLSVEADKAGIEKFTAEVAKLEAQMEPLRDSFEGITKSVADLDRQMAERQASIDRAWKRVHDMQNDTTKDVQQEALYRKEIADSMAEINKLQRQRLRLAQPLQGLRDEMTSVEKLRSDMQEKLDRAQDRLETDSIELDVNLDQTSVEAVSARLMQLSRDRVVTIWTSMVRRPDIGKFWRESERSSEKVNKNLARYASQMMGLRLLWHTMKDMVDIVPKLDMAIPKVATVTVSAIAAISAASTALGAVLSIGGDALKAFNLALMAPSVLAGVAGSALILGRAFVDFKKVLPDVVSYYERLGETISDRVWGRAADNIRKLQGAVEPLLNAYVPAWADSWGESLGALADGLGKGVETGHLTEFLENSIKGTDAARRGWENLGEAVMRMIGIGSRHFPALGAWFSDTMESFNGWVDANDKNGNMEGWISEGTQALKDMGSVAWSVGSILRSLGRGASAAGAPSLSEFAGAMRTLREEMKGPDFQSVYVAGLTSMHYFMDKIIELGPQFKETLSTAWLLLGYGAKTLAEPVSGALSGIMDGFNSPKFKSNIREAFENFGTFIEDITPGLKELTVEFSSLFQIVSVAAREWGPAFNEVLLLFADMGTEFHPGMEKFLEATGPGLLKLVQDLRGPAIAAADALGEMLSDPNVHKMANELLEAIGRLGGFILGLIPPITRAIRAFADWYANRPEWLQDMIADVGLLIVSLPMLGTALAVVTSPFRRFASTVGLVLSPLGALFGFFKKPLIGLARVGILGVLEALEKVGFRGIARGLMRVAGPIGLVMAAVTTPIGKSHDWMESIYSSLGLDGLANFEGEVKEKIDSVTGGRSLAGIAWDTFKETWGELKEGDIRGAFSAWGNGIWTQIDGVLTSMGAPATTLAEKVTGWLGLDELPGYKLIQDYGYDGTFGGMVESIWTLVTTPLDELKGDFEEKIDGHQPDWWGSNLWDWLWNGWGEPFTYTTPDGYTLSTDMSFGDLWDSVVIPSLNDAWASFEGTALSPEWWDENVWEVIWNGRGEPFTYTTPDGYTISSDMKIAPFWNEVVVPSFNNAWRSFEETALAPEWWEENVWDVIWKGNGEPFTFTTPDGHTISADMSIGEFWDQVVVPSFNDAWGSFTESVPEPEWWKENVWDVVWKGNGEPFTFTTPDGYTIRADMSFGEFWDEVVVPSFNNAWRSFKDSIPKPEWWDENIWELIWEGNGEPFTWTTPDGYTLSTDMTFGDLWNDVIVPSFNDAWESLKRSMDEFEPPWGDETLIDWAWGHIKDWLGIGQSSGYNNKGAGTGPASGLTQADMQNYLGMDPGQATKFYNESIKPVLDGWIEEVRKKLDEWNPITKAFDLGSKIIDWVKNTLGLDKPGGVTFDFDFSKFWPGIKTALTNGLLGLAGLIAAPGLILIAPLALPALIVGWLLGRDAEGNWSFSELQSKIEGAWEKIKEAIGGALATIGGLIGGLVFAPVITGAKIADWVVEKGGNFIENTKSAVGGAISAAAPGVTAGIEIGKNAIRGSTQGSSSLGPGFMNALLGVDAPGIARLAAGFFGAGAQVIGFGSLTKGEFTSLTATATGESSALSGGVRGHMAEMRSGSTGETGKLKSGVIGDMTATKSGATREAVDMARKYTAELQGMVSDSVRVVSALRSSLPAALRIDTTGAGRYTGSSYVSGLSSGLSNAVSVAQGMAGGIRSALSFSVYSSGLSVGGSFANGLRAKIGSVSSAATALAAAARTKMPNSPADEGPFSGAGWGGWGESIGEELARGLRSQIPAVTAEAEALMGSVATALTNGQASVPGIGFDRTERHLAPVIPHGEMGEVATGPIINVSVESRSEEPLQDGNRFGGDIAFALRGAGLA